MGRTADSANASSWRFFPWAIAASIAVVVAVNGAMIWWALATNPGTVGQNGFAESNVYDKVMDMAAAEAVLGWKLDVTLDGAIATLRLHDRSGAALSHASVDGQAERPLGPPTRTPLGFSVDDAGNARAATALPLPGAWDLLLRIRSAGKVWHVTRRIVVK